MHIRPYDPKDLDETVALWYRTWTRTFPDLEHPQTPDEWKARFRDEIVPRQTVWIAEIDGTIAGFMAMVKGAGYIDQMFVDEEFQGRGVGTALMAKAKELSPSGLSLHTLQRNTTACAFYERRGFRPGDTGINRVNGQPNVEYRWTPAVRPGLS